LSGPCELLVERLDNGSERYLLDVASEQLVHGRFYDFAKWGRHLAAGGLYRISLHGHEEEGVVFKVDAQARLGNSPMLGRLLRLNSPH
jgi:hypothetical protein